MKAFKTKKGRILNVKYNSTIEKLKALGLKEVNAQKGAKNVDEKPEKVSKPNLKKG